MSETNQPVLVNRAKCIRHLQWLFTSATKDLPKPGRHVSNKETGETKANYTYRLQTDFAYLINEITHAPECIVHQAIKTCNEFLDNVIGEIAKSKRQQKAAK